MTTMTHELKDFRIRRGEDRGTTDIGWLHSRHSFSFGRHFDRDNIEYHGLRVINDDIVAPGGGFGEHPHDNMEIMTWVLDGALQHGDSTGSGGVIRPGDLQVMSAGRGITHSEMNHSKTDPVHLLQIWIIPAERDLEPAYTQKHFPAETRRNQWQLLVSPDARDDSLRIHQDATLCVAELDEGSSVDLAANRDRHIYLHIARGTVALGGEVLEAGDAVTFTGPADAHITARESAQLLLFDLP